MKTNVVQGHSPQRLYADKKVMIGYIASGGTGNAAVIGCFRETADFTLHPLYKKKLILFADDDLVTEYSYQFTKYDFADLEHPTMDEVVTALNADAVFSAKFTASKVQGMLQIQSDTSGGTSAVKVGNGDANICFGFLEGTYVDISANDMSLQLDKHDALFTDPPVMTVYDFNTGTGAFTHPAAGERVTSLTIDGKYAVTQGTGAAGFVFFIVRH